MLAEEDRQNPAIRSLHTRLSTMDNLLWPSSDFPQEEIFQKISSIPQESQRIAYIEWLIVRFALVFQELNRSMRTFVWWTQGWDQWSIQIRNRDGDETWIHTDLQVTWKNPGFRLAVWDVPVDEQGNFQPLYRLSFPIYFHDDMYWINPSSKLEIHIGDNSQLRWALSWRWNDNVWREKRFLRLAYGEKNADKPFHSIFLYGNEKIEWVTGNGTKKTHVFDDIVQRIQALLYQMWDIGILMNTAREANSGSQASGDISNISF